jgi:hypothetical protein
MQGNYFSEEIFLALAENLIGERHFFEDVQKELKRFLTDVPDDLVYTFFS